MFEILLKEKLDIELKVEKLQTTYLALLKAPIRGIEYSSENDSEKAQKIILQKLKQLETISGDYIEFITHHDKLLQGIAEANEAIGELEPLIDSLFEDLHLEIPEDLKAKPSTPVANKQYHEERFHLTGDDLTGESSYSNREIKVEKEEDDSDKENSRHLQENSFLSDSDEYFSPIIQIQKSNSDCYTPAARSQTKVYNFKHQL